MPNTEIEKLLAWIDLEIEAASKKMDKVDLTKDVNNNFARARRLSFAKEAIEEYLKK